MFSTHSLLPHFRTTPYLERWLILIAASLVMMMGYVFWDVMSPLATTLTTPVDKGGMGWTATEYGLYAGSYSVFNIFLLMVFWGGVILDRFGIRLTGLMATGAMLIGALVNTWSVSSLSPESYLDLPFGIAGLLPSHIKTQVVVSALGFGLFGVGCDITGITVSKIITKWFQGHELASAMGVQMAMARLGTASAMSFSPLVALRYGVPVSMFIGCALLLCGFVIFILYLVMDKRFTAAVNTQSDNVQKAQDVDNEQFSFRDFVMILRNPGFWLIALLCVAFYSSIRPFMKFATDLIINDYGVSTTTAGWIVSAIPYGTIFLTPLFGVVYDRIRNGAVLLLAGCAILSVAHLALMVHPIDAPWFALVAMVLVGVAFSLVPSALWPSVPKLIPLKQLGTAYSMIYYIQNLGLLLVPMWVGNVIDRNTPASGIVDFTMPVAIFLGFALTAVVTSLWLVADGRKFRNCSI